MAGIAEICSNHLQRAWNRSVKHYERFLRDIFRGVFNRSLHPTRRVFFTYLWDVDIPASTVGCLIFDKCLFQTLNFGCFATYWLSIPSIQALVSCPKLRSLQKQCADLQLKKYATKIIRRYQKMAYQPSLDSLVIQDGPFIQSCLLLFSGGITTLFGLISPFNVHFLRHFKARLFQNKTGMQIKYK